MTNNWVAKALLYPFSIIYGIGVAVRNLLYDTEIIKSSEFSIPVISVGNLSIGGAGKTPHIEYLIDLLNPYINVATLSRGYNRDTKGFRLVHPSNSARLVGDEPLMYARKHRGIVVAVGESRSVAIPQLIGSFPDTQIVLLDDAFQHRSVSPFYNILLTQYEKPFTQDTLLPAGRLREWKSSYERADIIIITKCPDHVSEGKKEVFTQEIKPKPHQELFFTKYRYENPYSFYYPHIKLPLSKDLDVIVLSAIANTSYLISYLEQNVGSYSSLEYADHHNYNDKDIDYIIQVFNQRDTTKKCILTTEKDAMRLDIHRKRLFDEKIPVYILPLKVEFLFDGQSRFDELVKEKLLSFMV